MKHVSAFLVCTALTLSVARAQDTAPPAAASTTSLSAPAGKRLSNGEYKAQIKAADATLKTKPKDADARLSRATAHLELKNYEEAVADYTALLKTQPSNQEWLYLRGTAYLRGEMFQQANTDFTKILKADPKHKPSLLYRGVARMKMLNFKGAIPDFGAIIEQEPENADALEYRGVCYSHSGQDALAMQDLEKAAALNPEAAKTLKRYRPIKK